MLGRQKASLGPPGDPVKGSCQGLGVINYGSAGSAARHRQGWGETSRVVLLIGGHRGSGSRLASPGHRDRDTGVAQGARGPDRATGLGQRGRERGWRASSVRPGRVPLSISVSPCPSPCPPVPVRHPAGGSSASAASLRGCAGAGAVPSSCPVPSSCLSHERGHAHRQCAGKPLPPRA